MNINDTAQNTLTKSNNFQSASTGAYLNNDAQTYQNIQTTETDVNSFKGELEKLIDTDSFNKDNTYDIEYILKDMDFADTTNIDTLKIDKNDAIFITNMINQGFNDYSVGKEGNIIDNVSMKTVDVSKTLNTLLQKASETKKAVRLDFDNNVTVILKLNSEGKVNAQFIPGDKAVEEYLKNNIPYLKQRFDEQNITYANINYKPYKDQRQGNGQNNNNKGEHNE